MTQGRELDYFEAAKSWYHEQYETLICTKNRFLLSTLILIGLLALALLAITLMMPLKTTVYRIIEVNQQTGELTVLKELEGSAYQPNWAMTHYMINQYILQRERYSYDDIKRTFNNVIVMSNPEIADSYMKAIISSNPNSPINTYKKQYHQEVEVMGIDRLNDTTALVRFQTKLHNNEDTNDVKDHQWHAVVKWHFENKSTSLQERDINPFGFKVDYYEREPVFSDH